MAKVGRPKKFRQDEVISLRLDKEMADRLRELAALQSLEFGGCVRMCDLIRAACEFTYLDNENLRACFRASRMQNNRFK